MKNIIDFQTFESIDYDKIKKTLYNTEKGTPIVIKRKGDKGQRTVYYKGWDKDGTYWASYHEVPQDLKGTAVNNVPLTSPNTKIIKIGREKVESYQEFKSRIEELEKMEKEWLRKDAYHHSKKYPNIDDENPGISY